jgi:signal transduction histidine kinase
MLTRLESAFRRIAQFTADASHELRTPLAIIRTTAEVTLSRPRTPEEQQRAWKSVLDQTDRTTELVNDLLALTRADSGAEVFDLRLTDIAALVAGTVSEMGVLAGSKGVSLHFSVIGSPSAAVDEAALRRLFTILLDNALKATPAGGLIDISVTPLSEEEPSYIVVTVKDTGVGISPEDLPHIFDRFYRASKDRSRESGGAGLGLAIAHWIVSRHGGVIQVESEVGHGATFRVLLPLAAEAHASFTNSSESPITL